jgi:hypothetical protein
MRSVHRLVECYAVDACSYVVDAEVGGVSCGGRIACKVRMAGLQFLYGPPGEGGGMDCG